MHAPARSSDFISGAVALADQDALRVALYQNTRDPQIGALPVAALMSDAQRQLLQAKAAAWLAENPCPPELAPPSEAEMRSLCELALGRAMGDLEFAARQEIASFRNYPWFAEWKVTPPAIPAGFRVAIIGGGYSGIITAVQLRNLGIDYVVLERRTENGGVWSINRYPDVRVDTISITYELPFVKGHAWQDYFARGSEVRDHLEGAARTFGVRDNTLFDHDVRSARWDDERGLWVLTCQTAGGEVTIQANAVITCSGLYATPNIPNWPGKAQFAGDIIHPSRWPADLDLAGKKVAIFGNGSTGVQMVKSIAEVAGEVAVFQRTPQWIMPRDKYGQPIPEEVNWLLATLPGYANWWRFCATAPIFETHGAVSVDPEWQAKGGLVNPVSDAMREQLTAYIREQVGGRQDLIDRLVPDYAPMSRRPVVDNGWYASLTRDNVRLVTEGVGRMVEHGIELTSGEVVDADVIVSATGFAVEKFLWPMEVIGRSGRALDAIWDEGDGPRAYLGMMYPDFPNFFTIYGPNSQPISGGPAQPAWFATWASFVARQLMHMLEGGAGTVEVTPEAFERYNRELDEAAESLVAMSDHGGFDRNYYVSQKHKRLQVNAPWYSPRYWQMCADPDWGDVRT
jgi:4-hydroxyacetophenone monooxygenase